MHTHGFVSRQTKTRAKAEGEQYSSVSADYRHGSSGGDVDWWLVRCHGESGEVVDVSIFFIACLQCLRHVAALIAARVASQT